MVCFLEPPCMCYVLTENAGEAKRAANRIVRVTTVLVGLRTPILHLSMLFNAIAYIVGFAYNHRLLLPLSSKACFMPVHKCRSVGPEHATYLLL